MNDDIYVTTAGDMWDLIAFKVLGSEYLLPLLLEANQQYCDVYVFGSGTEIVVPQQQILDVQDDRPDWLQDIDEFDDIEDVSSDEI